MATVDEPVGSVWIINPDLLSKRIEETEGLAQGDANLSAVIRIEAWLTASIETYQTIGVETVLSTAKYRALVDRARERGFEVNLIYVYLDTPELNIERVRTRVEKGGHDVPENRIVSRRLRSFEQFGWFFFEADRADVYNNSGSVPRLVMSKAEGAITSYARMPIEMVTAIDRWDTGFGAIYESLLDD